MNKMAATRIYVKKTLQNSSPEQKQQQQPDDLGTWYVEFRM